MMLSPILMTSDPPCLNVCFSSSGSSAASSTSPTFSSSTARPNRTPFSSVRSMSFSESLITSRPFSRSMFLIHLLACICGSIMSGQRRALDTMMPFSTETVSVGSPAIVHARMRTGSCSVRIRLVPALLGTPALCSSSTHSADSCARYAGVNGPEYAIAPDATTTSPIALTMSTPIWSTVACHRIFSPPRPPMSLSARCSLTVQSATCFASASFLSVASLNCASSMLIFSSTTLSLACASARLDIVDASSSCAPLSAARLGATWSATLWYTYMARTHMQIDVHALDTLDTASGVNSSSWMNGSIFLMVDSGMLSLS
mmetsp:Transcript_16562/g.49424  ORF Transcript_16562/g.49424 Transcript_16562/m.49424 type:complete len:316 (+) Transcript_16562:2994-3941(+)